jgi:hypothetical protein
VFGVGDCSGYGGDRLRPGRVLVVGGGFAVLFGFGFSKRLGVWLGEFIVLIIAKADERESWMLRARDSARAAWRLRAHAQRACR